MVQGVGYRYFCLQRARHLKVNGWVKNNRDGSVEIEAEGDRGSIEELIKEVKVGPFGASVRDVKVDWRQFTGEYNSFDVTY